MSFFYLYYLRIAFPLFNRLASPTIKFIIVFSSFLQILNGQTQTVTTQNSWSITNTTENGLHLFSFLIFGAVIIIFGINT